MHNLEEPHSPPANRPARQSVRTHEVLTGNKDVEKGARHFVRVTHGLFQKPLAQRVFELDTVFGPCPRPKASAQWTLPVRPGPLETHYDPLASNASAVRLNAADRR